MLKTKFFLGVVIAIPKKREIQNFRLEGIGNWELGTGNREYKRKNCTL